VAGKRKFAGIVGATVAAVAMTATMLTANIGGASGAGVTASAAVTCAPTSKDALKLCTADQLRAFYSAAPAGLMPAGYHEGFVLLGDFYSTLLEALWGGKTFNADGSVVNHGGISEGLTGKAYFGKSALDGKPSIIVEYPNTLFALIKDEIRQVAPGVWIGYAVLGTLPISTFGLI